MSTQGLLNHVCFYLCLCFLSCEALMSLYVFTALQVIGGNMTVFLGETAVLPCKLINGNEPLTQISWQRQTRGKPRLENFFTILPKDGPQYVNGHDKRFHFIGSTDDKNGSLQLSNVNLTDEGIYICIFTLFPSGHYSTEIPLNVLGISHFFKNILCVCFYLSCLHVDLFSGL